MENVDQITFVVQIESNDKYANSGPPYHILLHPALGPLWEVTSQKVSFGERIRVGCLLLFLIFFFLFNFSSFMVVQFLMVLNYQLRLSNSYGETLRSNMFTYTLFRHTNHNHFFSF